MQTNHENLVAEDELYSNHGSSTECDVQQPSTLSTHTIRPLDCKWTSYLHTRLSY